jgi:hypothetical protein
MANKGGQFERDLCRVLSVWWAGDPDTDVLFWRTSQSGGRATQRAKSGRRTHAAHCGDIAALDERGAPLTRLITFEAKRGYPATTLHAMLDHHPSRPFPKSDTYPHWIDQASAAAAHAGTPYWCVVHARPGRDWMATLPAALFDALDCTPRTVSPPLVRIFTGKIDLVCCKLTAFLDGVTPAEIRRVAARVASTTFQKTAAGHRVGVLPALPARPPVAPDPAGHH